MDGAAQLLSVWLEPLVEVEVVASPGRVSILVRLPTRICSLRAEGCKPPQLPLCSC